MIEIKLGKFKVRWLGPYKIIEVQTNGVVKLSTLDNILPSEWVQIETLQRKEGDV